MLSMSTYVPSGLSTSMSTSTEIRYSSTTSTSTKYSGPQPWVPQQEEWEFTKEDIFSMIDLVIDHSFFKFWDKVFRQSIGIPMGIGRRTREFHFLDANSLIFVSNRQWYVVDFDFDCRCGSHFGVIASCFEGLIMWIHHSLSVCFRKDMLFN